MKFGLPLAQVEPVETNFWAREVTSDSIFSQPFFWLIIGTIAVFALAIFALSRLPSNYRRPVAVGVTFLAGLFYVLEWLLPKSKDADGDTVAPVFSFNYLEAMEVVSPVSQILTGLLLALGVLSIFQVHFGRLFKKHKDWFFSLMLLLAMALMITFGIANWSADRRLEVTQTGVANSLRQGLMTALTAEQARLGIRSNADEEIGGERAKIENKLAKAEITQAEADAQLRKVTADARAQQSENLAKVDAALAAGEVNEEVAGFAADGASAAKDRSLAAQGHRMLFFDIWQRLDAAMFSLIAFFILSAAYRAFRIRSIEATILMATALVVLLSFVPMGLAITSQLPPDQFIGNFRIDSIGGWLIANINMPAIRAIDLGLGLGVLAMGLRIMLGLERGVAVD